MVFGLMFRRLTVKHTKRILDYEGRQPLRRFFDRRSYLLMACMMGGGIALRAIGVFPPVFVAFFYTGLGCALLLAGVLLMKNFFCCGPSLKKETSP